MALVTLFAEHFCSIMAGQDTPTTLVTGYSVMGVSTDWHNG
jgi:hypothetical protein